MRSEAGYPKLLSRGELGPESPLWTEAGVCVDLSLFNLERDLKKRLVEWLERGSALYDLKDDGQYTAGDGEWDAWVAVGRRLFDETCATLAGVADVVWDHDD